MNFGAKPKDGEVEKLKVELSGKTNKILQLEDDKAELENRLEEYKSKTEELMNQLD